MLKRLIFPIFNTIMITAIGYSLGTILGYRTIWILGSLITSLLIAGLMEVALYRSKSLYRWRLWLAFIPEVLIMMLVFGPYAFVVQQTQPKPSVICCQTPADFGAEDYRDMSITVDEDVTLKGWYAPPPNDDGAMILVIHGINANRMASYQHAEILYDAGFGVILYDQRALGESTGNNQSFGWLDVDDVSHVIDFALEQPEVDPNKLGLAGLSLGGHIGLPAAAQDERIQAVFVDGVAAQHAADYPPPASVAEHIERFYYGVVDVALAVHLREPIVPIVSVVENIAPRPALLFGGDATGLEGRTTPRYADLIGDSAEVWIIPDGGHLNGIDLYPDEYKQRMITFFQRTLLAESNP